MNRAETVPTTCAECSAHCGALLTVSDGRVTNVAPNPDHPYSRGAFCIKGIRGLTGLTYHKLRLLHPLRRMGERGAGSWQRISWDEALDAIADGLAAARAKYGPLSLAGAVSNANCNRGVTVPLLLRSLGSPNVLINQDLCGGCRGVSSRVTGLDIARGEDIEDANCALVAGRNSYAANPVEWTQLKNLKKRGGRIIVLDPKRTPAADIADLWLRPRPGTDAAIGLAMMHVLIRESLYDREFVTAWCTGFDSLKQRVAEFAPEAAERLSGVRAADIESAARIYADGPSTFVSGHGIDAFSAGVQTFRAFHCLLAISGNVDRRGGNLRVKKPRGFRDFAQVVHDPAFRLPREIEKQRIGAQQFPLWSGPEGWQAACHNPSAIDAMLTGNPYPLRAMYISGVNPVVTYPDTHKTVAALKSLDFLAVAADMMTPTAALADIALPKTTGVEEEDVKLSPGGCVTYTNPAVPPQGEARCDLDIAIALLDRMGARGAVTKNLFRWRTQSEFTEFLLGDSGITIDNLRRDGYARFKYRLGDFGERPFPTPSGKIELYATRLADLGLDPLPNFIAPAADSSRPDIRENFPLLLLTGDREKTYHHSRFREQDWAQKVSPDPRLLIHPETARELAFTDGAWVRLETEHLAGACLLKLKVTDATPPGVVSTGMGWWKPGADAGFQGAYEININAAVSYHGPWDPMSGSADTRGRRCRIRAA
ncbi:MAG TPA: molybdopterin-dependent oxidoreductase [Micropepsaceae bacterium]|nr:molybdopterin-dependent oxidoreductase [Micropepsaceae bacterium]